MIRGASHTWHVSGSRSEPLYTLKFSMDIEALASSVDWTSFLMLKVRFVSSVNLEKTTSNFLRITNRWVSLLNGLDRDHRFCPISPQINEQTTPFNSIRLFQALWNEMACAGRRNAIRCRDRGSLRRRRRIRHVAGTVGNRRSQKRKKEKCLLSNQYQKRACEVIEALQMRK